MGIILSCFKGIGKTYLENTKGKEIKIVDLTELDSNDGEFVDKVLSEAEENDIVYVASDDATRSALNDRNVNYDLFYPSKGRRKEFVENEVRKHSNPTAIRLLDTNFESLIDDIEEYDYDNCFKHRLGDFGQFIGNNSTLLAYIAETSKNRKK